MATSGSGKASSAPKKAPLPRERPSSAPKKVPLPRELPSTSTRKRLEAFYAVPGTSFEVPERNPNDYRAPRAGNRAGVGVKASEEKKTAGSKGRNAGRVSRFSRSMDDTPKPKKSGNPRGGNRSGVKMK